MNKNMELMKKIIEEKKKESAIQGAKKRPSKSIGSSNKGFNNTKNGGVFDK